MREIKFRGKRVFNGEWLYGSMINNAFFHSRTREPEAVIFDPSFADYDCYEDIAEIIDECEVDIKTVSQYTGLKDKNGKEIYEGDILEFKIYDFNRNRNGWTVRGQVEFACGQFVAFNLEGLCAVLAHGTSHMEVIGNIHENPELLEADK